MQLINAVPGGPDFTQYPYIYIFFYYKIKILI